MNLMAYSEKAVERLERTVPERAARAVKAAYKHNLNAGQTVLIVSNGILYSVQPDMRRIAIKSVPKRFKIAKGTKIKLN